MAKKKKNTTQKTSSDKVITKVERVYSPINDKNIKKNVNGSNIWKKCYTEDEFRNHLPESLTMFEYQVKFKGLTPIQVTNIKQIKENVHVLTLTATPIPRTLQMSLTGVKDLSLITTPPVDRVAVRTSIMPFDRAVIKQALLKEHARGGQSFFIVPRIKDLPKIQQSHLFQKWEAKILLL